MESGSERKEWKWGLEEKERLIMEQGERVYLTAQGKKKEDQAKNKGKIPT